ncbi:MAG: lysophospholipid acyltransferase family protein [Vulcanimicrobiaceae bacterium]
MTPYDIGKMLSAAACYGLFRLEVRGRENVPLTGPLVVAANHVSYVDPLALGVACPRPIAYMAKAELFAIPVLGPLIRSVKAYPVERGKGDIAAIRASVRQLRAGHAIGIFPEGTRNLTGDARVQTGVALLASLADAPVVPAFIHGTAHAKRLGKVRVAFGDPFRLGDGQGGKASREDLAKWADMIMARIRALGETLRSGN